MKTTPFTGWRAIVWPIQRDELNKFLPLVFSSFLLSCCYHFLKIFKESFIITANRAGAHVLPFIKVWAILPAVIIGSSLFAFLASRFGWKKTFVTLLAFFLSFFLFFAFVVFPSKEQFHLHSLANILEEILPDGLIGLVTIIRYWTFTLFYVFSELWGSLILFTAFWTFIVQITHISQAKRFYGLISTSTNVASILAGSIFVYGFNNTDRFTSSEQSLQMLSIFLLLSGIISYFCIRYCHKHFYHKDKEETKRAKKKQAFSFWSCLKYLCNAPYLLQIALTVICYNIVNNLIEFLWKTEILLHSFQNDAIYRLFHAKIMIFNGIGASLISWLLLNVSIKAWGWTRCALLPPLLIFFSGIFFFSFLLFRTHFSVLPLIFGNLLYCCMQVSKFTFFDTTKEWAFTPLKHDIQLKGKTVIDGVGSRIGKSGGAFLLQGLVFIYPWLGESLTALAIISLILSCLFLWGRAAKKIGKTFDLITAKRNC